MFMSNYESMFVILKQRKLIGIHLGKITIFSLGQRQGKWHFKKEKKERKQKWSETEMKWKESNETKRKFQSSRQIAKSYL